MQFFILSIVPVTFYFNQNKFKKKYTFHTLQNTKYRYTRKLYYF